MARNSHPRHVSDTLLRTALTLFGLGVLLLAARPVLAGAPSELLQTLGTGLATPAPLVLLAGLVLGAVGYALKPRTGEIRRAAQATLIPADSTDFAGTLAPPTEAQAVDSPHRPRAPARAWCAQVLDDIEWRRFETLCERLFAQPGRRTVTRSRGLDGADLCLHSQDPATPQAIVRCRHGLDHVVGVQQIRELREAMASHGCAQGTYASPATFTPEARQFARAHGIATLDGEGLLERIARLPAGEQAALLAHAYEGEYWRPTCAQCGLKMVRHSPRAGAGFWACADAPRCRFTLPVQS